MSAAARKKSDAIRTLNDRFRRTFVGGTVTVTAGVAALPDDVKARVLASVRMFSDFDIGNDPHREHDFASFEVDGENYFFKIDYYDRDLQMHSPDPADPAVTTRVLTVMKAEEY